MQLCVRACACVCTTRVLYIVTPVTCERLAGYTAQTDPSYVGFRGLIINLFTAHDHFAASLQKATFMLMSTTKTGNTYEHFMTK